MSEHTRPFLDLPLDRLASAALERATALGCSVAQVRIEQIAGQYTSLRDARLESTSDDVHLGIGLRVICDGSVGFAATVALDDLAAASLGDRAVEAARVSAPARATAVELADEPSYGEVSWRAPYEIDPTTVPLADKVALLEALSGTLLASDVVDHVSASLYCVAEDKYYSDLAGTTTRQRRVRVHPSIEALARDDENDTFESMRTIAPPAGRGFEYLQGVGWDLAGEVAELPELLSQKLASPSVDPGFTDLVIDPTNLWLTIHESVGHATELDRALGYEAAYAGTSFATPDQLGSLAYGSQLMNITGDRTTPFGLATIGYDDEGVLAQSFPIVVDGVLVGFQLDRQFARLFGADRSNGCSFADSPLNAPIQRMANVSLKSAGPNGPSVEDLISSVDRGIYIVGDKSWSIDMQRYNFQFTGQRFFAISKGKITGQLRDVAYQATTTQFWGALASLGGDGTYLLGGAMNCGKGQPGQVAPVSHGCPAALFSGVRVLNTKTESGR